MTTDPRTVSVRREHEARDGDDILIGLWNTGFGEPEEFCFQVIVSEDGWEPSSAIAESSQSRHNLRDTGSSTPTPGGEA